MSCVNVSPSIYVLDDHDILVEISPAFGVFARDNGAPELTEAALLGTSIWDYVAGASTRELYAAVFAVVRERQKSLRFPFRCDSPTCRRFMDLVIAPQPQGGLKLAAELLRAEPRPAVALLDPYVPRVGRPLESCSFCRALQVPGRGWLEVEEAIGYLDLFGLPQTPPLVYAVCPRCVPEYRRRLGYAGVSPA